jgi:hypothetical protein
LGIKDNEAVVVAIGGTLITNTISMLILAIVSSNASGFDDEWYSAPAIFMCFSVLVVMLVPKFARWFFRTAESETYMQYIFIITILFSVASIGKMLGIEPVIGAFLAGLAVNTLIPANSILMNRIGFVGNTLFIPFFLMYVGMLTDVRLLFGDWHVVAIAALMLVVAVGTKYLAAYLTQKLFFYSKAQKNLIFGLTNTQAANTLAVVMVGVQIKLFPQIILDGSILLMLGTCIISAFFTEKAARTIASQKDTDKIEAVNSDTKIHERILLLLSNPLSVTKLVDLAALMKNPKNENPIYPLTLVVDSKDTAPEIAKKQKLLEQAQAHASGTNQITHLITRVDVNVASGVKLASKEFSITHTILGWNSSQTNSSKIFGTILEHVLSVCDDAIIAAKTINDWHAIQRFVLFLAPNSQLEQGFSSVIVPVLRVAVSLKTMVILYASKRQLDEIMRICTADNINLDIVFEDYNAKNVLKFAKLKLKENDFSAIICGRKSSISFSEECEKLPKFINYKFPKDNFMLVYPPRIEKETRHTGIFQIHFQ